MHWPPLSARPPACLPATLSCLRFLLFIFCATLYDTLIANAIQVFQVGG